VRTTNCFYDYDYEIAKFSLPRIIFAMPLPRFPLELDIGARSYKTRLIGLPDGRKSYQICLAV